LLNKRVLSAVVLIPVVAVVVWLGGYLMAAMLALVAVLAANEVADLFGLLGVRAIKLVVLPAAAALVLDALWPEAGIVGWCVLLLPLGLLAAEVFHRNRQGAALNWAAGVAAPLYVGYALSFFLRLRQAEDGLWWLALALAGTWVSDTAAYLVGVRWGKRRLAPGISPKKSWEGVWGGLAGALLFVVPMSMWLLQMPWWAGVVLAVALTIVATLGDLAESVLKRQAGAKDSSQLIPGHGGMLDRIDSLLFVVPMVYVARLIFLLF
jgi:phosphatidate cytidylyltransferase